MKKLYSGAVLFFILGSVLIQGSISGNQIFEEGLSRVGQKYVAGEFLVKFKPNVSEQTINALNSSHGVSEIYVSPYTGARRLRTSDGTTVADMVDIYQANSNVEYAEANYIAYAMKARSDELYPHQWHLQNTRYGGIKAESAWTISTGCTPAWCVASPPRMHRNSTRCRTSSCGPGNKSKSSKANLSNNGFMRPLLRPN